jgi:hypothetical protein
MLFLIIRITQKFLPSSHAKTSANPTLLLPYYVADGNLAGINIDNASRKLDLRELLTSHIPLASESV